MCSFGSDAICKELSNIYTMMKLVSLLWFKPNSGASAWNRKRVETAFLFYFIFTNRPLPPPQIHNVPVKNQLPPQWSPGSDSSRLWLQKQVCESKILWIDLLQEITWRQVQFQPCSRGSGSTGTMFCCWCWNCHNQTWINKWNNTTIKAPNAFINLNICDIASQSIHKFIAFYRHILPQLTFIYVKIKFVGISRI